MKKFYLFFSLLVIGFTAQAAVADDNYRRSYGEAYIFVEGGVEFAIYPDGQFDFYYDHRNNGYNINISGRGMNFSYNSGYNYDPYVQYDDFGAVIQIENVPVYYDYYGRIVRAGHVEITYNHFGMLARVGHLHLHYNRHNHFTHYTGYINAYNRYYVHRPWHQYYMRPYGHAAIVYHQPYRAYYHPNRMKYGHFKNYYRNHYKGDYRRSYYDPGDKISSYHRGRRTSSRRDIVHTGQYEPAASRTRSNQNSSKDRTIRRVRRVQEPTGSRTTNYVRVSRDDRRGSTARRAPVRDVKQTSRQTRRRNVRATETSTSRESNVRSRRSQRTPAVTRETSTRKPAASSRGRSSRSDRGRG